jgi:hypothetical protein
MHILLSKLKYVKSALKSWNRTTFGNIFNNINKAREDDVLAAQIKYDT